MKRIYSITVQNKKYDIELNIGKKDTQVVCKGACIDQEFLTEDIGLLLRDLPYLIISEKEYQAKQQDTIRFRVNVVDKQKIEKIAAKKGFKSVSSYLRSIALKS